MNQLSDALEDSEVTIRYGMEEDGVGPTTPPSS